MISLVKRVENLQIFHRVCMFNVKIKEKKKETEREIDNGTRNRYRMFDWNWRALSWKIIVFITSRDKIFCIEENSSNSWPTNANTLIYGEFFSTFIAGPLSRETDNHFQFMSDTFGTKIKYLKKLDANFCNFYLVEFRVESRFYFTFKFTIQII